MVEDIKETEEDSSLRIDCPVLVTDRLVLRKPHETDASDLARLANNPRIAMMLTRMPHPYGEADAGNFLDHASRRRSGCIYAVTLAANGRFIGCAGLEPADGALEIGYWFGQPFWGKGYATETAHALVDTAFRCTAIERMEASCRVTNSASRRVLHKCGFQFAGHGMKTSQAAGRINVERYRLDRATWIGLKSWTARS
ncbi:MAG: GNAT family N-acetyltransferase [Zhengella sp.]|uniref:GNAT family N-acetyltransferase n=1 Tax=Zhengella sp. TaxID=2282762 RepID=UPI001DCC6A75|nr:GNAT family N-acetyltransferase [Notoacmeibacter sp.]MCC0027794.1 GNAT family N-acetyltransferase [Brucellaceae bacterium]